MKRFYFTNENGDDIVGDYRGNIRGARRAAQNYADKHNETVSINDCETEDIVDVVFPPCDESTTLASGAISN